MLSIGCGHFLQWQQIEGEIQKRQMALKEESRKRREEAKQVLTRIFCCSSSKLSKFTVVSELPGPS